MLICMRDVCILFIGNIRNCESPNISLSHNLSFAYILTFVTISIIQLSNDEIVEQFRIQTNAI